jgi:hypothetical protein
MEATSIPQRRTTDDWIPMSDMPEGQQGDWIIERFTVSESAARLDAIRSGARSVRAGTYTRLLCGRETVMSDTHAERRDHMGVVMDAHGDVLVTGLGLGLVAVALLRKPEVRAITVIERSADVIALVAPTLRARYPEERLEIVQADAYAWKLPAGRRWTCAWHDIWTNLCGDNTQGMGKLRRHYARRIDEWQRCWAEAECKAANRRDRQWGW